MSGYYVACPRCTNQLYDDGQLAGELVMCPRCGQQFQMPARDVGASPAVAILSTASSTRSSRQRKRSAGLPVYQQLLFGGVVTVIGMALLASLRGNLSNGMPALTRTNADNDLTIKQERLQSKIGTGIDLEQLKQEWRLSRQEVVELGESMYRLKVAGVPIEQVKLDLAALRNVRGTVGMLEAAPKYAELRAKGVTENSRLYMQGSEGIELFGDIKRGAAGPVSDPVKHNHRERKP